MTESALPEPIARSLHYFSGYQALERAGLDGLLALLQRILSDQRATMLVIDDIVTAEIAGGSDLDFRRFVYELHAYAGLVGCTIFLLADLSGGKGSRAGYAVVDGLVELRNRVGRRERELAVRKLRGSDSLPGWHPFEISAAGLVVSPALRAAPPR